MPYRSEKQRKFMHAQHPEITEKWDKKYGGKIMAAKKKKQPPKKKKGGYERGYLDRY